MGRGRDCRVRQKIVRPCSRRYVVIERRAEDICAHCAMTSTAIFEIIDLTDTRTPSDNETQNISTTAEYSTDLDPGKSATGSARKRKNGEPGRARGYPVKSRDGSLERGHAQSGEDTKPLLAEDAQERIRETTGKKKRRSKKNKNKDKDSGPPSREETQQEALLTSDDGQLFLVDTEPAAVPEGMAFDSARDEKAAPSSSSQTSGQDKVPLLLPAHVSVLDPGDDLPVQIIQPAESDSDSESYIEYLDYDDRLVRLPPVITNLSLISHRHPTWCAILRPLLRNKSRRALCANDAAQKANTEPTNAPY